MSATQRTMRKSSASLRRYPVHFRQITRPRYFETRSASLLAMAPAVDGFHGLTFLCSGMTVYSSHRYAFNDESPGEELSGRATGDKRAPFSMKPIGKRASYF